MTDPVCCGEAMQCLEYDSDEDLYLYVCQVERTHHNWVETDEETWK